MNWEQFKLSRVRCARCGRAAQLVSASWLAGSRVPWTLAAYCERCDSIVSLRLLSEESGNSMFVVDGEEREKDGR